MVSSLGNRVELRECEVLQRGQEVLFLDLGAGYTHLLVKSYQFCTYFTYTCIYTLSSMSLNYTFIKLKTSKLILKCGS